MSTSRQCVRTANRDGAKESVIRLSALAYIVYLVFRYAFIATPPSGYTSIIASVWLFSGLIIFFLGIQGVYLAKVFSEVKQRPYTIVRHIYRRSDQMGNAT